jgi:lysophospholipase L1-like esterase
MPDTLHSNVYWLWIGMNDLITGYCSEEAVVLGILRAAEEISFHDPEAVVVVQGILPLSKHDGTLEAPSTKKLLKTKTSAVHTVAAAKDRYLFWPSIQAINKELEKFCTDHERMVYFDAAELFVGSMGNSVYRQRGITIMKELMPDYINPSLAGYKVLFKAINAEMEKIIFDENEDNDVEKKKTQPTRL